MFVRDMVRAVLILDANAGCYMKTAFSQKEDRPLPHPTAIGICASFSEVGCPALTQDSH